MGAGNLTCPTATVVLAPVFALVLTACGSVQQPETATPNPSQPVASVPSPNSSQPEAATPAGSSVLDGVFTARQASRGETTFGQVCAACHRINDFRGGRFRVVWVGRTVGDLFQTVSTLMPEDDPGSLSPEEYSAIISYMLRENGYPAGEEDLAADASTLQDIRVEVAGE
jgi:mono/diheme cytochrome c family protein